MSSGGFYGAIFSWGTAMVGNFWGVVVGLAENQHNRPYPLPTQPAIQNAGARHRALGCNKALGYSEGFLFLLPTS